MPAAGAVQEAVAEIKEDGHSVSASGEETQQVQLVVADVEEALDSETEEEKGTKEPAKDKGTNC